MTFDLIVVGGGPIGLATAIEARLAGLSVVVVEPRTGPIDKACGEGVMPGAVLALERIGVSPVGHPIAGFSYLDGRRTVEHRFATNSARGVRRTVLHGSLSRRAEHLGVEFVAGKIDSLTQTTAGVQASGPAVQPLSAKWLVGSDGLHSTIRALAGLERSPGRARKRFGLRQHFRVAPWNDLVEVHWGRTVEAYVTPVSDDLVGISMLGPQRTNFTEALESLPALAEHLRGKQVDAPVRGAGPLRQRTKARSAGRVLLVGDASGYVDALTGEGLRVGLAQAKAAVASIVSGGAPAYERAWVRETRDFRVLTGGLVAAATSPLRGAIVPAAAALPGVYSAIVERLGR